LTLHAALSRGLSSPTHEKLDESPHRYCAANQKSLASRARDSHIPPQNKNKGPKGKE
jgi:hypothetical protein